MKNILSQDEVDSLLDGISEGKVETGTAVPETDESIAAYDFRRQDGPITVRMPTLHMINERFVGILRTELTAATRSVVDVNISSTESMRFGEFFRSLPLPTSLNIFKMEPLRGFSLLVMEGTLVFSFVDTLFGGKGTSQVKLEGRNFTSVESKIINKIVKIALSGFQQAWSDVYEIKTVFARSEMDPQFAGIVTPNDMVIVTRFIIDLENASGSMTLCIPHATLEPVRDKLRYRFQGERLEADQKWRSYIERRIQELHIDLGCSLGTAQITGKKLLEMKISDVLVLNQKVSDPILINVEGIPKFKGRAGTYNKRKAIRIEERLDEE
ncbi:MAG: flagellar motor switch protein FliM [Thermodesulfobacteriota bacterium]